MEPTPQRAPRQVLILIVLAVAATVAVLEVPPWSLLTREDLTSCGKNTRDSSGQAPQDGVECLWTARATDNGAALEVTDCTTRGGPVFTCYRVAPDRSGVEVFAVRHDGHGKKGWTHGCRPQARAVPNVGTCQKA